MTIATSNEKDFLEVINTAANPEKAIEYFITLLDQNSIAYKILELMPDNYTTVAEFAKAVNMSEQEAFNIMNGKTEPTLDQVIIIAKVLNKEPEEIAQLFINHFSK